MKANQRVELYTQEATRSSYSREHRLNFRRIRTDAISISYKMSSDVKGISLQNRLAAKGHLPGHHRSTQSGGGLSSAVTCLSSPRPTRAARNPRQFVRSVRAVVCAQFSPAQPSAGLSRR